MSRYKSIGDLPPMADDDLIRHPGTYRYFSGPVLYPFGYGLSHASFVYSRLSAEKQDGGLKVSPDIKEHRLGCRRWGGPEAG